MGREVQVTFPPQRIISLVPSQTEYLSSLALETETVGITKFCIHPERWFKHKTKVGGTKHFNFDIIKTLKPDLIIGNKEENYQEGIVELEASYPVWMSDINSLADALRMMRDVGAITDRLPAALTITDRINQAFQELNNPVSVRVLYLIWRNPWMAAGKDTFIDDMLKRCGFSNAIAQPRYPELSPEAIRELNPDLVFLSSEPFPFSEKHVEELNTLLPDSRIALVDGEMFSWYGSRLLLAPDYFTNLLLQLRMT